MSIFSVCFSHVLCCFLCLCFLYTSYLYSPFCNLEVAWSCGTRGQQVCIILLVQTNKLNNGDLRHKMPKNPSLLVSLTHPSRSEVSSGPDLNASQSFPTLWRGDGQSAEYSQKIHLNSFFLRYAIWQVLLEFVDGKKCVYSENSFSESLSTHLFPDGFSAKVKIIFFKEQRNFNKGLV